ncbi:MGH1-like glycoside hydrolase domain-containing protein [Paenibacillus sp. VMFN-D1]|uniref:MGH1-like glycoside hydrolase domain-containing protein n=1 Tax=Paenibacillus sp. VMFN-D1 TaxID=2135608 RepID=UPI000E23C4B8|nr:hypothetical protein [Paenibacillus sp. VMFN-D1]RED37414.1 hypothetical protein C7820_4219 [Paenibacillus sp. VMFN-D1]
MNDLHNIRAKAGAVTFRSDDDALNEGFAWAKRQALSYAHFGEDAVGLWYEAALPAREAFCMRDVMHHSAGAAVLGLSPHTKNMIRRFAENIAESRDWCTFWEITKDNLPAAVDYDNDQDFWYNLPANFDLIETAWRQFLWTGDRDYIEDAVLRRFYDLTLTEYVDKWDRDKDGILEYYPEYGRRGLASYNEAGQHPLAGGDMVGVQIAAYRAAARMAELTGNPHASSTYAAKAHTLEQVYGSSWWNENRQRFYGMMLQDRSFADPYCAEGNFLPLYYGAVTRSDQLQKALKDLEANGAPNVEGKTYLPDIYYRYGLPQQAFGELKELVNPALERREYPEVSFCVVGAIATGMMGIAADGTRTICTLPQLGDSLTWAEIEDLPVLGRTIQVRHERAGETSLTLQEGQPFSWKAMFQGNAGSFYHNGERIAPRTEITADGREIAFVTITVEQGETHRIFCKDAKGQ